MVKEAEENKEKDAKIKEQTEIKYRAESLITTFEKTMNDEKAKNLSEDQKKTAQKQIDELKDLLKNEKWDELKKRLDAFEQVAAQFANQQNNNNNNSQSENNTDKNKKN